MIDPFNDIRRYMVWTFILIIFLIVTGIAVAGEKVLHSKIKSIAPEKVDGQYCFVKVEIVQEGDTITKREILECADGRKAPDTPGYWELFAQFYYSGLSVPPYCRQYARPNHPFKTPGMMCLSTDGVWEVQ